MRIDAYWCGVCVPTSPGGYATYGALVKVDGNLAWADVRCIGQGYRFDVTAARLAGVVAVLKKLKQIHLQHPLVGIWLYTDSKMTTEQLRGDLAMQPTALLETAQDLLAELAPVLTLRFCKRRDNLAAHELCRVYLRRHGIQYREGRIR